MKLRYAPSDQELALLARRMVALRDADMPLDEWEDRFVGDVNRMHAQQLTERQAAWIAVLCWRHRAVLPAELVPAQEPAKPKARQPGDSYRR